MAHYHRARELPPGPVVFDPCGPQLQPHEAEMLAHPAVGGVILFAHNVEDPAQLAELVRCCREARRGELVVMVDQEGGRVQRFRQGFSALPEGARYGEAYDREPERALAAAEALGWLAGRELRGVGVDLNLAPVADLQSDSEVIGRRALHARPETAAALAAALVAGLRLAGVAATAKHFPGHGGVAEDTHHSDARDPRPLAELREHDLQVFARLAASGVDAVMPAHVVYPAVDERPAGYSSRWIGDILRGELGFAGAVLSDDLSMAAAGVAGAPPERATQALAAGCDLALVCQCPAAAELVIDHLGAAPADPDRAARVAALRRAPEPLDDREQLDRAARALAWLQDLAPE